MGLPNLEPPPALATVAAKRITAQLTRNVRKKKASFKEMRQNDSNAKLEMVPATACRSKGEGKRKRKSGDNGKPPCANYSKGNDYCKWGDNCRFYQDWPKGLKRKSMTMAVKGTAKKQKQQMMSMLVKVLDDVGERKRAKGKTSVGQGETHANSARQWKACGYGYRGRSWPELCPVATKADRSLN
jgi:hypothetical protein